MEIFILIWVVCGIAAAVVASNRNANGCLWFGIGVLFGPFGLAFAFMSGSERKCPYCRKGVANEATKCPYCQSDISQTVVASAPVPVKACVGCGLMIPQKASYCSKCGKGQGGKWW